MYGYNRNKNLRKEDRLKSKQNAQPSPDQSLVKRALARRAPYTYEDGPLTEEGRKSKCDETREDPIILMRRSSLSRRSRSVGRNRKVGKTSIGAPTNRLGRTFLTFILGTLIMSLLYVAGGLLLYALHDIIKYFHPACLLWQEYEQMGQEHSDYIQQMCTGNSTIMPTLNSTIMPTLFNFWKYVTASDTVAYWASWASILQGIAIIVALITWISRKMAKINPKPGANEGKTASPWKAVPEGSTTKFGSKGEQGT